MEIKYEITPNDLTYFSKEAAPGTSIHTMYTIILVVITVLFMLSDMAIAAFAIFKNDGSVRVDSFNILPRFLIVLAICGLNYVVLMTISKRLARKACVTAGKNGFFCEHTIHLAEDGFTESTHVNRNFTSWEGVEEIKETSSYVIIVLRLGASYFIPKRAFSSVDEIRRFVDTAQAYTTQANIPPPPAFN